MALTDQTTQIMGPTGSIVTVTGGKLDVNATVQAAAGGSTSAKQDDQIALETTIAGDTTSIDGKITECNTGNVTIGAALPAGTNAIGKLAANSGVDIGDVDILSLPALAAGTALIGKASVGQDTSTIYNGMTALTPKYALANIAASQTDSNIVTAVAGKKIRVHQIVNVTGGTATDFTFNSKGAGAGTAISPLFANGINGGEVLPFSPMGWFETASGEGLTGTTGAGATTGILIGYTEV